MIDNQLDLNPRSESKRMLSVAWEGPKRVVHINPSSLTLLQTCPKKSYYALTRGLVPLTKSTALDFGTGIHKALEIYYAAPREERTLPPNFKNNIMLMCQGQRLDCESSSIIYRATRGFIESAASLADLPIDDKRSIVNGGWLLGEYFESRRNDPYEVYVHNGIPMIENLIEHTIWDSATLKIVLFGTVDCILKNMANDQLVVCDHKTASQVGAKFYNRTKPNHQYSAYILLAQRSLGLPIDNFMINCFEVKPRPKTSRGAGPNFLHIITKRSQEDLEDLILTTHYYVTQYLHWLDTEYFPHGPVDACGNYGQCTYLKVCESPENIKTNIIQADFTSTLT